MDSPAGKTGKRFKQDHLTMNRTISKHTLPIWEARQPAFFLYKLRYSLCTI